jgi:hypothetical protein
MNNKELQAETEAQQSKTDELLPSAPLVASPLLAAVFLGIWEGFKTFLAWGFIIYLILFIVIGGQFSFSIKWENIVELWRVLNGS